LQQHNETLRLHTAALASGNLRLEREVARRKAGERTIRQGKAKYKELFLKSQVMQRKLRQLTRQIISAQEDERKQISRELHDGVVQTLIGINVELAALGEGASVGRHALKAKIARTQRLVTNSVNAVHRFARELRPAVLDDLGLIPALHAYNKSLAARKKIKIKLTAFGGVEAMGSAKRTVLFRVAQEALTNVARHSQATQVRMSITEISGAIRMEISDNGKSFQVDKVLSAKNHKRLGLVGMRERVEMVGGSLTIESSPGKGTTVRVEIPFTQEKTKK
jgi:signal transduction histidine kinase